MTTREKEQRLNAISQIANITVLKNKKRLATIKEEMRPQLDELYEILCAASKGGLRVNKYFSSENGKNTFYFDYDACVIKNNYVKNSSEYFYIDKNGDVYTSCYACSYGDGVEKPRLILSDTFKQGPCSDLSITEEYRLSIYQQLGYMIDMIKKYITDIYADIDYQIACKQEILQNEGLL